jgi:HEAT repeat protein
MEQIDKIKSYLLIFTVLIVFIQGCNPIRKYENQKDIESLILELDYNKDGTSAKEALVRIGEPAIPFLIEALEKYNRKIQQISAEILIEIGVPAVKQLIDELDDDNSEISQRILVVRILGEIGDKRAVEPLIARLTDDNDEIRQLSASMLGELGNEQAIEPLLEALIAGRISEDIIIKAIDNIGWQPNTSKGAAYYWVAKDKITNAADLGSVAVEPLIKKLESENEERYEKAKCTDALVEIGEPAIPFLIEALKKNNTKIQQISAEILIEIGDPAVKHLIDELDDDNSEITQRIYVVRILGEIGDKRAVEPLIKSVTDENISVCVYSIIALRSIGDKRAVEPLIKSLTDENIRVREESIIALGSIGDKRAVDPLIGLLDDRSASSDINREIAIALQKIGVDGSSAHKLIKNYEKWGIDMSKIFADNVDELTLYLLEEFTVYQVYPIIMRIGNPNTINSLIKALDDFGTVEMAEDYLNSGSDALENAAESWADDNGYTVSPVPGFGGSGGPKWGNN